MAAFDGTLQKGVLARGRGMHRLPAQCVAKLRSLLGRISDPLCISDFKDFGRCLYGFGTAPLIGDCGLIELDICEDDSLGRIAGGFGVEPNIRPKNREKTLPLEGVLKAEDIDPLTAFDVSILVYFKSDGWAPGNRDVF